MAVLKVVWTSVTLILHVRKSRARERLSWDLLTSSDWKRHSPLSLSTALAGTRSSDSPALTCLSPSPSHPPRDTLQTLNSSAHGKPTPEKTAAWTEILQGMETGPRSQLTQEGFRGLWEEVLEGKWLPVDLRPGPGRLEAPHQVPVLRTSIQLASLLPEAAPGTQPRDDDSGWGHLDDICAEPCEGLSINSKDLVVGVETYCLTGPKTARCQFPCLSNLPPPSLECLPLSSASPSPLRTLSSLWTNRERVLTLHVARTHLCSEGGIRWGQS